MSVKSNLSADFGSWNAQSVSALFSANQNFEICIMLRSWNSKLFVVFPAVGFVNGAVRLLDAISLQDEVAEPFRYARDAITHVEFSHDSKYLATAVSSHFVAILSLIICNDVFLVQLIKYFLVSSCEYFFTHQFRCMFWHIFEKYENYFYLIACQL